MRHRPAAEKLNINTLGSSGVNHGAFVMRELLVVVGVFAILTVLCMFSIAGAKKSSSLTECTANLRELGLATASYAQDNANRLPFAFIKYSDGDIDSVAWDTLIFPYIGNKENGAISSRAFDRKHAFLRCPADTLVGPYADVPGSCRRTYSMNEHNMTSENWPPGQNSKTGVGLWWSDNVASGPSSLTNLVGGLGAPSSIRLDAIPKAAGTLLYTEQVNSNNVMFSYSHATIKSADPQIDPSVAISNHLHDGKFNCVMIDAHVELLQPRAKPNIWMINQQH